MRRALVLFTALFLLARPVAAGPAESAITTLTVSGDLPRSGALGLPDLKALGATTTADLHVHGARHRVVGVPLEKVLRAFGFTPGAMGRSVAAMDKRDGYRRVVVAQAPDGFQAVFSLAEIAAEMGTTQVLVVWESDGKPLPLEQGPLRLAVLTDKEPSRSLHNLQQLVVVDMRKIVPPRTGPR